MVKWSEWDKVRIWRIKEIIYEGNRTIGKTVVAREKEVSKYKGLKIIAIMIQHSKANF